MTTSAELLDMVVATLSTPSYGNFSTDADDRVKSPGYLRTQSADYPILKVRLASEFKQSLGRDTIMFQTTATIRLIGEVSAPVDLNDPSVSDAEASLWRLKQQAEIAIINSYPLFRMIQQLVSVNSQLSFTVETTHLAGFQSDYTFEIIESGEDFAPIATTVIEEGHAEMTNFEPRPGFTSDYPAP